MTAVGPGGLRPDDGFEEPASQDGRRTWAQRWHSVRLLPLILLVIAALIATVTGVVTARDAAQQVVPPGAVQEPDAPQPDESQDAAVTASVDAVDDVCAPAPVDRVTGSPWTGEARDASESAYAAELAKLENPRVAVPGDGEWMFWGDIQANNFSQALGRSFLNADESDAWAAYFGDLRAELDARDIDLVIQVVPADWSVYPEMLPDWAEELRGPTTLDYLLASYPELPIMDMRQALRDAKAGGAVYAPGNSHWSPYGAAIGWGQLAACLASVDEKYAQLGPLDFTEVEPVPAEDAQPEPGLGENPVAWVQPVVSTANAAMLLTNSDGSVVETTTAERLDMLELPAVTETADPQSQATALIVRDSQGNSIGPAWQTGFASTKQIAHNLGSDGPPADIVAEADEFQPDVVVFEVTERHLNWIPALPE